MHKDEDQALPSEGLRVLHFVETLYGGLATYLNQLLPLQRAAYGTVTVFCPKSQSHLIEAPGVEVISFAHSTRNFASLYGLHKEWRSLLKSREYNVIQLHSSFAGVVGRLHIRRTGARIVYCAHGWAHAMETTAPRRVVYALLEFLLSMRTDAVINISRSEEAHARWARIPKRKCSLIYNGMSDNPWLSRPVGLRPRRLLFVGRYDRQKGIDLLVEAMKTLVRHGFSLETIGGSIIGKSPVAVFPPYIVNKGWQNPACVHQAMGDADIIVMPSRWEGFGLVAVEAMRAGRPVVAANVGGLAEIVVDGETGVLIEPGSSDAIVDGVLRLAELDVCELGENARKRYETLFCSSKMFARLDSVYRKCE